MSVTKRGDDLVALTPRALRHVARGAAWADAALLARERDEPVVRTVSAVQANEAALELATGEVALKRVTDEARERFAVV